MVRLQLAARAFEELQNNAFNPTMVRLQRITNGEAYVTRLAFNPTMVRLQRSRPRSSFNR